MRVPAEVLKQRMQVLTYQTGLRRAVLELYRREGTLGFYRGFQATLQREIPFACLQYPAYEYLKAAWKLRSAEEDIAPWKGAVCGSLAGAIAGILTTPLDVIKTRIMLAEQHHHISPVEAIKALYREGGMARLFAGGVPRMAWIAAGGFLFFGAYEKTGELLHRYTSPPIHS